MSKYKLIILIFIIILITVFTILSIDKLKRNKQQNLNEIILDTNKIEGQKENQGSEDVNYQNKDIKINVIINNKKFSATLNNNETVRALIEKFPLTLEMKELHSNEKYNYLDFNMTTNMHTPNKINAGEIKLYGDNCLVLFFKSFSNSYSYTDIGKIDDVNSFKSEIGEGNIKIQFE